jgi:alpha-glucosidase
VTPWWQTAVIYQIYPRSFCDRSGDGVGDLAGIAAHLDHVADLGADAVWLSPIFPSPMADFGYDVADYCGVDPLFGSLADLDRLIDAAHARHLRVLLDWVPNHTSDQHPWFRSARASVDSPHRDWYIWRPGPPYRPPNNWRAAFPGVGRQEFPPAWTWDQVSGEWYLHLFLAEQPDLNWANPQVQEAMFEVLRFWLDRGVDGFRIDVIHALGKDPTLPDLPAEVAAIPACAVLDDPRTHPIVARIREVVKGTNPDAVIVGETYVPSVEQVAAYYGSEAAPELDLAFNFHPLFAPWRAADWRRQMDAAVDLIAPVGWPSWALGNHDNRRQRSRYGGSEARARAAAVLLLTQVGTPFLYAGEELGLADADVPDDRRVDPGGRDGCRAPLPWSPEGGHGWAGDPWLPWPPEHDAGRDMSSAAADPHSTLNLYRRLIAVRRASPALSVGGFEWLPAADDVLCWRRFSGDDERVIAVNFGSVAAVLDLPAGDWAVDVATGPGGSESSVGPNEAVVLRPA